MRVRFDSSLEHLRNERGVALVEFALVAPLLFLLVFGMLDFGKAFNYWIDETHLASVGARIAATSGGNTAPTGAVCLDGTTPTSLVEYLQCTADTQELRDNATVSICPMTSGAAVGDPIRVKVTLAYSWLTSVFSFDPATTLQGSTEMRLERNWTGGSIGSCP